MSNEFIGLFLGTLRKFTPKGQEMILKQLRGFRQFYNMEGKSLKSLAIWDIDDSICLGRSLPIEKELVNESESLSSVVDDILMAIKKKGVAKGKGTVLCKTSGKQEPIYIDEVGCEAFKREGNVELCARNVYGQLLGKIELGETLAKTKEDTAIYIHNLATNDNYKGVGTELIRKAVELSQKLGLNGRVKLTAWTGQLPESYLKIAGQKSYEKSAALIYHKMGFRAIKPELEQKITDTVANGGTGLSSDGMNDYLAGHMTLSEEGIRQFLA